MREFQEAHRSRRGKTLTVTPLASQSPRPQIRERAKRIWSTYLHDADDGACPINIDNRTRRECQQLLGTQADIHLFEKAQAQIFQLMKYDSYTRFLKSDIYKACMRRELDGKSISHGKQVPEQARLVGRAHARVERSIIHVCHSQMKLKDEEKKDKKRSAFLPWTKGKADFSRHGENSALRPRIESNYLSARARRTDDREVVSPAAHAPASLAAFA